MAQLALGVVGAAVGSLFGMPQLGWAVGSALGGALAASQQKIYGPRLSDLKVTGADYGAVIPWIQGAPRMAGQIWWASDRREIANSESAGKGGGPTVTSYTYEIDAIYGLTDGEIGAVTRIWWNGKLVWINLASADDQSRIDSSASEYWREIEFYRGGADQLADPTYEAAVGIGQAPGYRGRSYVIIKSVQLGNSGQLPNLTFEVSSVVEGSPDFSRQHLVLDTGIEYHWVASAGVGRPAIVAMRPEVRVAIVSTTDVTVYRYKIDGEYLGTGTRSGASETYPGPDVGGVSYPVGVIGGEPVRWQNLSYARGGGRKLIPVGTQNGTGADITVGADLADVIPAGRYVGGVTMCSDGSHGLIYSSATTAEAGTDIIDTWHLVKYSGGTTTLVRTGSIEVTQAISYFGSGNRNQQFTGCCMLEDDLVHLWHSGGSEGDITMLRIGADDVLRVIATLRLGAALPVWGGSRSIWAERGYCVAVCQSSFTAFTRGGDSIVPVALEDAVRALCERAGMTDEQFDVSELATITKPVRALAVGQVGATRQVLEQLQTAYFFDAALSDKLRFRPRAGTPVATIPFADLAAGIDDSAAEPLELTVASDLEVPSQVAIRYANVNADQQPGTEYSDRILSDQASLNTIELALGLTPAEAKGVADAIVVDSIASLISTSIRLPLKYARLEATDVVLVADEDGVSTYRLRFNRKFDEPGVLSFEAVVDDADVVTSAAVTDNADTSSMIVRALSPTLLYPLDIALLRDADDAPGYYVAARGTTSRWPGAVVLSSSNGVDYTSVATVDESAVMGQCTTTLGAWAGGWVMDEVNTVTTSLAEGELASTSRETLLSSDINTILIGDEVVRFLTATLLSSEPNVYKLTRLLRGQRGTEWAIPGHVASERAVLLQPRGLRRVVQQAAEIGQVRYLKGVTFGAQIAAVAPVTFTTQSVSQEPFAPVDARAARLPNSDIAVTWKRRTRYATRFVGSSGGNVPLGEAQESYEVEVLASPGGAVRRTLLVDSAACAYTAAMQSMDFGSLQSTLYLKIYQLSAVVGRGYPLTATLSAPTAGASVGQSVYGMRPVMEIGSNLIAASISTLLFSTDAGANFSLGAAGSAQAYGTGVSYWDAKLGTQRISIGLNVYANIAGLIIASDDPMAATTQFQNNVVLQSWYSQGYPRAGAAPIGVGALFSDGSHYYIVGREADQSQTTALMYLYRADASLVWSLQGQLQQGSDPNELPFNSYGSFNSSWFVPNSTSQSVYNQSSVLTKYASRWFLRNFQAVYYSDDTGALTGWMRCPMGLAEGLNTTVITDLTQCGSALLAISRELTGVCLSVSADNGTTWAASRPIPLYGEPWKLVAFGSTALLYYAKNGIFSVASATAPFTSWTTVEVDGVPLNDQLDAFVVTSTSVVARLSDYTLVQSTDGLTYLPAAIS